MSTTDSPLIPPAQPGTVPLVTGEIAAAASEPNTAHPPTAKPCTGETKVTIETCPPEPNSHHVHEDADVQEYLNRLLGRSPAPLSSVEAASPSATQTNPVSKPEPVVERFQDHKDFVPRFVAPETNMNLKALREVANQSSRSAIESSVRKRRHASAKHFVIGSAASVGFGILFLILSQRSFDGAMLAGLTCFVASGVSIWFATRLREGK